MMKSGDFGKIVLSLKIINGVLKKYRNFTGEDGEAQLAQILAVIQEPVLSILLVLLKSLFGNSTDLNGHNY